MFLRTYYLLINKGGNIVSIFGEVIKIATLEKSAKLVLEVFICNFIRAFSAGVRHDALSFEIRIHSIPVLFLRSSNLEESPPSLHDSIFPSTIGPTTNIVTDVR